MEPMMMNTRLTSLSVASVLLGIGLAPAANVSFAAPATSVRVCTFPGSPTSALDTSVAREAFRVAGVPAVFGGHGIKDAGDDDGVSVHELVRSLKNDCDVIAGFPLSSVADGADADMLFSQGYLRSGYVSITPMGGNAAAAGEPTVAATYSSPSQLIAVQQKNVHFDLENTSEATVDAVAKGRAQRAIAWYPAVVAYEHAHSGERFSVAPTASPYSSWNLVFAFNAGNGPLKARIDAALTTLRDNHRLASLTRDWTLPRNVALTNDVQNPAVRAMRGGIRLAGYHASSAGGFTRVSDDTSANSVPSFDSAQVAHGQSLYASSCAKCHGAKLEGDVAPALSGAAFAPASNSHITVGGIYQYMSSNMPADHPGQLKDQEYADLMAFLLYSNGYSAGKTTLTAGVASASTIPLNAGPRH
jgi:hypothetical protein